jgi:hypothetical protein
LVLRVEEVPVYGITLPILLGTKHREPNKLDLSYDIPTDKET